jgi:hypothetical protein
MDKRFMVTVVMVSICAFACSDDHGGDNVDVEGCEHLREGPAVALTATATADTAPAVAADHQRYDVTLIAVTGGQGGFVRYAASAAGDYVFFLGADVPARFVDAAGAAVTPEESASSSTACAEIKGRHLVPLEVGTYGIDLGPTTQTSVGIVVEEAMHAH